MRKIIDRLKGYQCSRMEARTLWYAANGFQGRPTDADLRAIRRDPPADKLAMLRDNLDPRLLSDRP